MGQPLGTGLPGDFVCDYGPWLAEQSPLLPKDTGVGGLGRSPWYTQRLRAMHTSSQHPPGLLRPLLRSWGVSQNVPAAVLSF